MSGFLQALRVTLSHEGGYSDHAADRGGATMWGITQATYDRWRLRQGQPVQPVAGITEDEAEAIYHDDYWHAAKCDALPWPVSMMHFDHAVNHGPKQAARLLQRALRVTDDGVIGPVTLAAAEAAHRELLVYRLGHERRGLYLGIVAKDPSQGVFLRGWMRRAHEMEQRAAEAA